MPGRKKKKFVDKKVAETYRLVHRSLRDPTFGTEGRSDYVLAPVPPPNLKGRSQREVRAMAGQEEEDFDDVYRMLREQDLIEEGEGDLSDGSEMSDMSDISDDLPPALEELPAQKKASAPAGDALEVFPDDGYDYGQHLRPIGGGTFVPKVPLPEGVFGVPELAEDADLIHPQVGGVERYLDPDVLAALEGDVSDVEELEDDFLYLADKAPTKAEAAAAAAASAAAAAAAEAEFDRLDLLESDDFSRLGFEEEPRHFRYQAGEAPAPRARRLVRVRDFDELDNPSVLDAKFERMVHEFSDDEIGELDDEDPRLQGNWDLGNLEGVLDEFLDSQKPLVDPSTLVPPEEIVRRKNAEKEVQAGGEEQPPQPDEEEEEEEPAFEWVSVRKEAEWDCQSILSTYSEAYNHPKLVDVGPRPKIELSKRGLPLAALSNGKAKQVLAELESDSEEEEEEEEEEEDLASTVSVNHGAKRKKKETAEERRARKAAVKAMRRERRQQKKDLKTRFKEEAVLQGSRMVQNSVANPSGMRLH